jgi:hypothetical protein
MKTVATQNCSITRLAIARIPDKFEADGTVYVVYMRISRRPCVAMRPASVVMLKHSTLSSKKLETQFARETEINRSPPKRQQLPR